MSKPLVILESPHKCLSVRKYTQNKCDAVATVGHIKDLPANSIAIEEDENGKIDFDSIKLIVTPDHVNVVKNLKSAADGKDVFIATDPDREGEFIADEVNSEIRRLAKSIQRIEIHAITEQGVNAALKAPRQIDKRIVNAAQCRRFIDRLVGYKLTKYASKALGTSQWKEASVGRTQSAALKMVYDRDKEIENFNPEPYWKIQLIDKDGNVFTSKVFKDEKEAIAVLEAFKKSGAFVKSVEKSRKAESSPKPLTASTLQQKANKKFGWTPKQTMGFAQELYQDGRITYMRTDSPRLAPETQDACNKFLKNCFADIAPDKPPVHVAKGGGNVQDAHEAIHPTDISKNGLPDALKGEMSSDQFKLYKLVCDYFYASQAKPALYDTCKVTAATKGTEEILTASGKTLVELGWRKILGGDSEQYHKPGEDEPQESKTINRYVENSPVQGEYGTKKDFTKPPAYYTMDTLLTALEKNSIGRPATWAALIDLILDRNYVKEDKRQIKHTPKGDAMVQWLMAVCPQIASVKFTALMEDDLALIEEGKEKKENVVNTLNGVLNDSIVKAKLIPDGKYHFPDVDYSNASTGYYVSKTSPAQNTSKSGYKKSYGKSSYSKSSGTRTRKSSAPTYKKTGGYHARPLDGPEVER